MRKRAGWINNLISIASNFDKMLIILFCARIKVCTYVSSGVAVVLVVSMSDFGSDGLRRSEGRWFKARLVSSLLCFFFTKETLHHCLSSPRCINGYQRHTAGNDPVLD